MKKILVLITILVLSLCLVACGEPASPLNMIKEGIVRCDTSLIVGENDSMRIELLSYYERGEDVAKCPENMSPNNVILKLMPKDIKNTPATYSVVLKDVSGEKNTELSLKKDILGMSFSTHVSPDIITFDVASAEVKVGEETVSMDMVDVLKNAKIQCKDAVEIGYSELEKCLETYFDNNKYTGTAEVKLIHNNKDLSSPYYIYVTFCKDNDNYLSCLIDPSSGVVVNKKTK